VTGKKKGHAFPSTMKERGKGQRKRPIFISRKEEEAPAILYAQKTRKGAPDRDFLEGRKGASYRRKKEGGEGTALILEERLLHFHLMKEKIGRKKNSSSQLTEKESLEKERRKKCPSAKRDFLSSFGHEREGEKDASSRPWEERDLAFQEGRKKGTSCLAV